MDELDAFSLLHLLPYQSHPEESYLIGVERYRRCQRVVTGLTSREHYASGSLPIPALFQGFNYFS